MRTLAPESAFRRFRRQSPEQVIEALRSDDDGLFAVGFDHHVGFVVKKGNDVGFCHSSWIGQGGACEDPASAAAWYSSYYVVGRLLDDAVRIAWLEGRSIPTRR